jgi:hypothetical protein
MPTMRSPAVRMTLRQRCFVMVTLLSGATATSRTLSVVPTRRRRSSFVARHRGVPSDRRRCGRQGCSTDARASAMMTRDLYDRPYDHQLDQVAVGTIGGWRGCAGLCQRGVSAPGSAALAVSRASQTQGSWILWPKRGCCSNTGGGYKTLEDNQRAEFDTMQGQKGPQAANVLPAKVRRRTHRPRDRSQTADAAVSGAIIPPIRDFRFERHNTEVVDDSRRLHRHGQCRVAADAL